jgi:hypothetical protein
MLLHRQFNFILVFVEGDYAVVGCCRWRLRRQTVNFDAQMDFGVSIMRFIDIKLLTLIVKCKAE